MYITDLTFHNFSTVAITDQAELHVNCVPEAAWSLGQYGCHGDNLLASMTAVEHEAGPLTDVILPAVIFPSAFFLFLVLFVVASVLKTPLDLSTCHNHRKLDFIFPTLILDLPTGTLQLELYRIVM